MSWVLQAILIVAAVVAVYLLFGLGLMLKERWFPRRCPRCRWRTLQDVGGARATKVDEQGHRHPDAWTDYKCSQCHALLRLHVGSGWEVVPPAERSGSGCDDRLASVRRQSRA